MRASQFHLFTLKEAPSDAEVVSQKLMLRAGMIRKTAAGIYSYMPLGLRAIRKVENIIREEMNRAGAMELVMPLVQTRGIYCFYSLELVKALAAPSVKEPGWICAPCKGFWMERPLGV